MDYRSQMMHFDPVIEEKFPFYPETFSQTVDQGYGESRVLQMEGITLGVV